MKILYEVRRLIGSGVCVKPQHVLLFFLKAKKNSEGRQRWKLELESGEVQHELSYGRFFFFRLFSQN